jgi:hypothetical protein
MSDPFDVEIPTLHFPGDERAEAPPPLLPWTESIPVLDLPWMHATAPEVPMCSPERVEAPPAPVLPDSVLRAAAFGYRFHVLAERLRGFLAWRRRFARELTAVLGNVARLRTLAELMYVAATRHGVETPSTELRDAARALERAAFSRVDVGYPYPVTHPSNHRAVEHVAGDILDLFHDAEGDRALEALIDDDDVPRLHRAAVLGVVVRWMVEAVLQVLRTQRAERMIELVEDALDLPSSNPCGLARHHAERLVLEAERAHGGGDDPLHERIAARVGALHDVMDGTFKLLRAVARHRIGRARATGSREAADRIVEHIARYFELDEPQRAALRAVMEHPSRENTLAANDVLARQVDASAMRHEAGRVIEGAMVGLSWGALVVLATEPESERGLDWELDVATTGAGAVADTILMVDAAVSRGAEGAGGLAMHELARQPARRALATLVQIAETANLALDVAQGVQNVVEGAHRWHVGTTTGDVSMLTYGGMTMTGGALVALGALFLFPEIVGVGTVVGIAAGALELMARAQDARTPPVCMHVLRMLRTLRLARVTEAGRSGFRRERWIERVGLEAEVQAVMDAAEGWRWWAIVPQPPSATFVPDWIPAMREGQRALLRRELFRDDEIEALVRDLGPGRSPDFRVEELTDLIGRGLAHVRL